MDGRTGKWMDGWVDGRTDGRANGWMGGWMDGWMDRHRHIDYIDRQNDGENR